MSKQGRPHKHSRKHFSVIDQGSMIGFYPHSKEAKQFIDENVHAESWQWLGPILWVDHRMACDLYTGLQEAELV